MSNFLELISVLFLFVFVVGIIKPKTIFWAKKKTRKKALLYLIGFIAFSVTSAALSPETIKTDAKVSPITQVQSNPPEDKSSSEVVNKESTSNGSETKLTASKVSEPKPSTPEVSKPSDNLNLEISEPNTSSAVDCITEKAKEDAKKITDEQINEATTFIKNNIFDYFKDNSTMEKTMYYGSLLEYGCASTNKTLSNIGTDAVQAVKYVYRKAETKDSQATKENLKQIRDGFEELNKNQK